MNNKYNLNLVNFYKNEYLYSEDIFDFILEKAQINELKETQFDIGNHNTVDVKGNFEAFLYKHVQYNSIICQEMNDKIKNKWNNELLNPLYFIKFYEKEYILEKPGYEIFKNLNEYLKLLSQNKINKLSSIEEKFVIDWVFKETPGIYLTKENHPAEIEELFKIFANQKEYLNKKNDKSTVNNFFEHSGLKKVLSLFTIEQKNSLMDKALTCEEILTAYYPKLLMRKQFDLADQLQGFESHVIVKYLKEKESKNPEQWFKPFLEKGSGVSMYKLKNKIQCNPTNSFETSKIKTKSGLSGAIKLLNKIGGEFSNEYVVKLIVAATIEAESEEKYKELRMSFDLPKDEIFQKYLNSQKIFKKTIDMIEKEILKDKLEEKFENKPKAKQLKI